MNKFQKACMKAAREDAFFNNPKRLSEKEFRYSTYKCYLKIYKDEKDLKKIEALPL